MQGEFQTAQGIAAWLRDAGAAGAIFILGLIVWGLVKPKPWLVPGEIYREKKEECDRLQQAVNSMAESTTRVMRQVEKRNEG